MNFKKDKELLQQIVIISFCLLTNESWGIYEICMNVGTPDLQGGNKQLN